MALPREEMSTLTTTNTEFIWKKNKIVIENGYLTTSGVIIISVFH